MTAHSSGSLSHVLRSVYSADSSIDSIMIIIMIAMFCIASLCVGHFQIPCVEGSCPFARQAEINVYILQPDIPKCGVVVKINPVNINTLSKKDRKN